MNNGDIFFGVMKFSIACLYLLKMTLTATFYLQAILIEGASQVNLKNQTLLVQGSRRKRRGCVLALAYRKSCILQRGLFDLVV